MTTLVVLLWATVAAGFTQPPSVRRHLVVRSAEVELLSLEAPRAAFLVNKWKTAVENDLALGHLPAHTHPNRDVGRLMTASRAFKDVSASCSALAVASRSSAPLTGPLSGARVVGTPRSKIGAALAVIRDADETTDVLHLVVNPETRDDWAYAEVEILDAVRLSSDRPVRLARSARGALQASDADLRILGPAADDDDDERAPDDSSDGLP